MKKAKPLKKKSYKSVHGKNKNVAGEPVAVYAFAGGNRSRPGVRANTDGLTLLEKMNLVRTGVTKEYLEEFKLQSKLDYQKLAKVLSVTRATLINKKKKEKFHPALSERIVGVEDLYTYGFEVFDDKEKFNQWMFTNNKALGGQPPYDLIDNIFGREEVRKILGRIEYGVYS
jgi:putative toxin-antitoxin system antitoxin component (TIGR02293 family)